MGAIGGIYDICRIFNLILAGTAIIALSAKAGRQWSLLDGQAKFLYLSALIFCVSVIWVLAETLVLDVPGGPRSAVITLPLVWSIIAGFMPASPARQKALERYR